MEPELNWYWVRNIALGVALGYVLVLVGGLVVYVAGGWAYRKLTRKG